MAPQTWPIDQNTLDRVDLVTVETSNHGHSSHCGVGKQTRNVLIGPMYGGAPPKVVSLLDLKLDISAV